jgi:hypothetical protein
MSFNSGLSQQPSYSFMPDFPGLSSTFEHESIRLPNKAAGLTGYLPIGIQPICG